MSRLCWIGLLVLVASCARDPLARIAAPVTIEWPEVEGYSPYLFVISEHKKRIEPEQTFDPLANFSRCKGSPQAIDQACELDSLRFFEVAGTTDQTVTGLQKGRKYGVMMYYLLDEFDDGTGVLVDTYIKVRRRKGPQRVLVFKQ